MRHPFGETVVHHATTVAGEDEYGVPVTSEASTPVTGVAVAMQDVSEPAGDGIYRVVRKAALFFDPPLVPGQTDEFTVRGERYTVDSGSELSLWHNPFTGERPGSEVHVRRVTG